MNVPDIKVFTDEQLRDELKRREEEFSRHFRVSADARGLHLYIEVEEATCHMYDAGREEVEKPDLLVICEQLSNGLFRTLGVTKDTDVIVPNDACCASMRNLCEMIDRGFDLVAFPVWKSTIIRLTAPPDRKK